MPDVTLFEFAGGAPAMQRLAAAHYARCTIDPVLIEIFGTQARPEHAAHLADWLTEVLGGPKVYTEQHDGHGALLRHHAGLAIGPRHARAFAAAFAAAADEAGLPDDPRFRRRLAEYVDWGAAIAQDVSQPGADTTSSDPVPVWDWGD